MTAQDHLSVLRNLKPGQTLHVEADEYGTINLDTARLSPHSASFLEEAGSKLNAKPSVKEAAEQSQWQEPTAEQVAEERMVSYLQEAALDAGEDPAAHLHVAKTEHTTVVGDMEAPEAHYKLRVSETPLGGAPAEIDLGTTIEQAVAVTARVFGKALDRVAEMVPRPPGAEGGEDDESQDEVAPGGFTAPPFDWGLRGKFLTYENYTALCQLAGSMLGKGDAADKQRCILEDLLRTLKDEGFVAEPEPSYIGIFIGTSPGQSRETAWAQIPKDLPPILMPCGHQAPVVFSLADVPCPCGNPKHWLLKWGEDKLDLAEGQLWLTSKGTTVKIQSHHPDHPVWIAFDQAQSTTDACRDLVDDAGYAVYIELPPVSGATQDKGTPRRVSTLTGPFLLHLVPTPPAGT